MSIPLINEVLSSPQEELLVATNPIEKEQTQPINVLITYNKVIQFLAYLDNLKEKEFSNQNEIIENVNNIYTYQNNVIFESNLPIEITNTLELYINNIIEFLSNKLQDLPSVYTLNVKNESSLLLSYRLYENIDNADILEKINNFEDSSISWNLIIGLFITVINILFCIAEKLI